MLAGAGSEVTYAVGMVVADALSVLRCDLPPHLSVEGYYIVKRFFAHGKKQPGLPDCQYTVPVIILGKLPHKTGYFGLGTRAEGHITGKYRVLVNKFFQRAGHHGFLPCSEAYDFPEDGPDVSLDGKNVLFIKESILAGPGSRGGRIAPFVSRRMRVYCQQQYLGRGHPAFLGTVAEIEAGGVLLMVFDELSYFPKNFVTKLFKS